MQDKVGALSDDTLIQTAAERLSCQLTNDRPDQSMQARRQPNRNVQPKAMICREPRNDAVFQ